MIKESWRLVWRKMREIDKGRSGGALPCSFTCLTPSDINFNLDDEEYFDSLSPELQVAAMAVEDVLAGRELYDFLPVQEDGLAIRFRRRMAKKRSLDGGNPFMSALDHEEARARAYLAWGI
jgi:hypothetical protein